MKETNSNGKNIAILAVGALSGIIFYFRSAIAQKLSDQYAQMSYKVHEPKIDLQTSSLIIPQSQHQQDSKIELKLLHLTIKKKSGVFNKLMQTIFREKEAFKKYFLKHKDSLAALLTNTDIITTHSETKDSEQLESLGELNLFLKDSTDLVYPTIGGKNPITNSLARVISSLPCTEHSKESISKFLQKVFNTKTAPQVSKLLNKAEELEIFSAFVKAFEKVEEKDFQKVVTTLMKEDDMKNKLKASKKLVYVPGDEINAAKLTLFTKFMHSVDKVNLDVICTILSYQQIIEHLAYRASKKHLNDLHQGECDRIKAAKTQDMEEASRKVINTIIDIKTYSHDPSEIFTLTQDAPCHQSPTWLGKKSTGLSKITGEKIFEVAASNYDSTNMYTQGLEMKFGGAFASDSL